MRASSEEFLLFLLWNADALMRPTWRSLSDSFEAWAFRNGLSRRLAELERQKLLEQRPAPITDARVVRLTESGRRQALGGCDPTAEWERHWDGRWRMVLFDISQPALRFKLRRRLRRQRFGYLQNSVWISPDSLQPLHAMLADIRPNVESCMLFEGRPGGGETDAAVVAGAWNFGEINRQTYLDCVADPPALRGDAIRRLACTRTWLSRERALWANAITSDPLLPRALLPADYAGLRAWEHRGRVLNALARSVKA